MLIHDLSIAGFTGHLRFVVAHPLDTIAALFELARKADVEGRRKEMWAGKHINVTEDRAVMHMALLLKQNPRPRFSPGILAQ